MMLGLCLSASAAYAGVQDITVTGVGVHKDIEQAQVLALEYAKRRALYELAKKWPVDDLETKLKRLDPTIFEQSLRGARTVDFKRNGDVLYTKTIVSVFDAPLRRALKLPSGLPDATPRGAGVIVLPVYKEGEQMLLWDKANPLRAPLRRQALTASNQSVIVPLGDMKDMSEIGSDNILQARYPQFKNLLQRYNAKEIVVALFSPPASKKDATQVLVNRIYDGGMKPEIFTIKAPKNGDMMARYRDLSAVVVRYAAERAASTAGEMQAALEKASSQKLLLRFTTMAEYGRLSALVRAAPGARELRVDSIALQEVAAVLYHETTPEKLRAYFKKKAVKLKEEAGRWIVSLR